MVIDKRAIAEAVEAAIKETIENMSFINDEEPILFDMDDFKKLEKLILDKIEQRSLFT
jgi:hypothetical protein